MRLGSSIYCLIFIIFYNIKLISNKIKSKSSLLNINRKKGKNKIGKLIKSKKITDYYFTKKNNVQNKPKNKNNKNNIIEEINTELNPNFNHWEKIEYKSSNIFKNNKKVEINYSNNDLLAYNIYSNIVENNLINEDYKKNDFLIRYNNNKNNQGEEAHRHILSKSVDSKTFNDNNNINMENTKPNIQKFGNYMPSYNKHNYKEQRNIHYHQGDEDIEYGLEGRNSLHHQEYNSMRYNSRSNHYKSSHPVSYSSNQNQNNKSKFSEYMNSIYQIMMVFFFFGFIYKFIFGNKQNDKYALAWYEANKDYFKERYEIFGLVEDEENGSFKKDENMKDCIMIKETPNIYKLICGNYRYIKYIAVSLQFHKRYDMSLFIASIFVTLKDKIVFQVTFNSVDPCGWVFFIGKKNQCSVIKDNYEDLNCFCEIYQPNFMEEYMCLISEDLDVFVELFNNKNLLQYYKNVEPFIETIYYSDIINLLTEENNIYFSFEIDLTTSYQNRIFLEITHFVNVLVDNLAQIKYTKEFKEKVNNNRMLYKENKINDSMKKEIEEQEKHDFIEKWKIKNKMKGKSGFERKKLEKRLKKFH